MHTSVFKPRPSAGWLWLTLLGLLLILISLPAIVAGMRGAPVGLLILQFLPLAIGVAALVLAAWFPTLRYELNATTLTLRYGPLLTYRIALRDIRTIRRRNLHITLWSSMRLPGLALFTVPYSDVGNVKMCATAAATDILLLETDEDKYGLTPADEEAFVAALRAHMEG